MQMPKKRELVLKLAAVVHRYVLCERGEKGPCIRREGWVESYVRLHDTKRKGRDVTVTSLYKRRKVGHWYVLDYRGRDRGAHR